MDLEAVRKLCREQFTIDPEDRGTLMPCPGCDGSKLVRLDTAKDGKSYKMFACPWCDGRGSTTSDMIKLYRQYQREGHV